MVRKGFKQITVKEDFFNELKRLSGNKSIPDLIRVAVMHYVFTAQHFRCPNCGRLLWETHNPDPPPGEPSHYYYCPDCDFKPAKVPNKVTIASSKEDLKNALPIDFFPCHSCPSSATCERSYLEIDHSSEKAVCRRSK